MWRRLRRSPDGEAASAGRGLGGGGGAAQARASPGGMPCSGCARCCSFGGGWRARARWLAHGAGVAGGWFARCGCRVTAALPTREVFAPRADAAVVPGSGSRCDVVRPGSTVPVDGDGVSSRQPFKRTKRMDRRLSHWQCTFCRHENPLSEQADVCGKCNGARQQLGDRLRGRGVLHAVSVIEGYPEGEFDSVTSLFSLLYNTQNFGRAAYMYVLYRSDHMDMRQTRMYSIK